MINDRVNSGFQPNAPVSESRPVRSAAPVLSPVAAAPEALPIEQATDKEASLDSDRLDTAVKKLNDYAQNIRRTLSFSVEESTGRTVISVYDAETDELIRQIPPEETLRLAEQLLEHNAHLFLSERA